MQHIGQERTQPTPTLLVGPDGQLRQAYNVIPTSLHERNPPKYKQTPLWGSKLIMGKTVTCSYNKLRRNFKNL